MENKQGRKSLYCAWLDFGHFLWGFARNNPVFSRPFNMSQANQETRLQNDCFILSNTFFSFGDKTRRWSGAALERMSRGGDLSRSFISSIKHQINFLPENSTKNARFYASASQRSRADLLPCFNEMLVSQGSDQGTEQGTFQGTVQRYHQGLPVVKGRGWDQESWHQSRVWCRQSLLSSLSHNWRDCRHSLGWPAIISVC